MNINNQISMFGNLIKEDVWSLKLDKTKGNKDLYFQSINPELEEKLKEIPDKKKVELFKRSFLSFIFDSNISRGIHSDMSIAEIFEYEYKESNMSGRGIIIFNKWFYEGSYIHLRDYSGSFELMVSKITDDYIEVSHRFGEDRYFKRFNSLEDLEFAMWSLDDVRSLDKDLSSISDDAIWNICCLFYQVGNNFNLDDTIISDYLNDFHERCSKEIRLREYKLSTRLNESEYLKLIAESIYKSCWDKVKLSIDNDDKSVAISKIKGNFSSYGCSFCHNRFNIGFLNCSSKGIEIQTKDKRTIYFSWGKIYDTIKRKNRPEQLDMLSILNIA